MREVVALRQQLRPHKDVPLPAPNAVKRARKLASAARAVAVDAHYARGRKARLQGFLDALRSTAERLEIHVAAGGAGARNRAFGSAMMAAQPAIGRVQHHARSAALAGGCPAAGLTGKNRGIASAVDEEQALLADAEPFLQRRP